GRRQSAQHRMRGVLRQEQEPQRPGESLRDLDLLLVVVTARPCWRVRRSAGADTARYREHIQIVATDLNIQYTATARRDATGCPAHARRRRNEVASRRFVDRAGTHRRQQGRRMPKGSSSVFGGPGRAAARRALVFEPRVAAWTSFARES